MYASVLPATATAPVGGAGVATLAATGFTSLGIALAGLLLVIVGLLIVRASAVRRHDEVGLR